MLLSTALRLSFTPLLFVVVESLRDRLHGPRRAARPT
jgi:hypothetical protein